jgi:energy-coupling factor transporter ATP-binding protein EcfA2
MSVCDISWCNGECDMSQRQPLRAQLVFGAAAAERDIGYGLAGYFVDTTAYERVREGRKVVVIGSRGSGKSAIFQMLARRERAKGTSVVELSPEDYSYEMMSSTMAAEDRGSWAKAGAYAVAWKHLLIIEVMRQLSRTVGNRGPNRAIVRYLRDHYDGFQDSPIAALISYLKRLEGIKIGKYEASVKLRELDRLYKLDELRPLVPVIEQVCEQHRVVVLVDELDRGWDASEDARAFVAGLFQAAIAMNNVAPNLKVYISLRQELYDTIPSLYEDAQKYRDLIEVLSWDETMLLQLIASRIRYSIQPDKHLTDSQCWLKVFTQQLNGHSDSFQYVVDRTLLRPREIIQFCTKALEGRQFRDELLPVEYAEVAQAERFYSEERTKDIAAEYRFQYPGLLSVFEAFRGGEAYYERTELEEICLELALGERHVSESATWIVDQEPEALIHILWRVGFIRARLQHCGPDADLGNRYLGYHQVSTLSVHNACGFEIHPMFQFYLDIGQARRLVPLPKFRNPSSADRDPQPH